MKKQNRIILGALVVLFGVGIALSQQRQTPSAPAPPAEVASELPEVAPTPAQLQPAATPNAPVSPRRKFADMGVLEANAILTEIAKQDLPAIFQAMLDAERVEHDPRKQMDLQSILATALGQKTPSSEFLKQMQAFITNSSNTSFERKLLIGALESASTKETVELLVKIAATAPEKEIRVAAGTLAGVGDTGKGGAALSPVLEKVWRESNKPNEFSSAASSMAKIGVPSGIELLLSAALDTGGQDKARLYAAQAALWKVFLPDAVPPLVARLANQPPTSATAKLVAPLLVRIDDAAGCKAVVGWLQGRSENATPLIQDLVCQQTRGEKMLDAWAAALEPTVPFRNEQNREAIRAGLAAYRAGHTEQQ
jgi:hypothetical protein